MPSQSESGDGLTFRKYILFIHLVKVCLKTPRCWFSVSELLNRRQIIPLDDSDDDNHDDDSSSSSSSISVSPFLRVLGKVPLSL